jgi:hypothetical protein
MVKKIILLLVCIGSLISCEIFFRTPFPEELIFFKDSVEVKGIGPYDHTRLYTLDDYVFLYVDGIEDQNKLYIYTTDLKLVFMDVIYQNCDTFAMKEIDGYYFIGRYRYDLDGTDLIDRYTAPDFGPSYYPDVFSPYGFGFSHNSSNFIVWWDNDQNAIEYLQRTAGWADTYETDSIQLNEFRNLEALYYYEDPDERGQSEVVLFFSYTGGRWEDIEVAVVPANFFDHDHADGPLTTNIYSPSFFAEFSFTIKDVEPDEYFFTGDGVVVYEHRDRYIRFNMSGDKKKTYSVSNREYSETYSLDGKTRFLFSERYNRLMKTNVWW